MIRLDLATVLGNSFPRMIGDYVFFHLHHPDNCRKNVWHILVQPKIPQETFVIFLHYARIANRKAYALSVRTEGRIQMPSIGLPWLRTQLDSLQKRGLLDRLAYTAVPSGLYVTSTIEVQMDEAKARLLADGDSARIKELLPTLEKALLHIASDFTELNSLAGRFEEHLQAIRSTR